MHRDYEASVNTKVPDERPQSIIVALDPFNIIYESGIPDTNMQTAHLYPGQAMCFLVHYVTQVDQMGLLLTELINIVCLHS